jgi:hypothetical protein
VRQVGPVLIKLTLQLVDDAGEFAPLLDKARGYVIFARGRASGSAGVGEHAVSGLLRFVRDIAGRWEISPPRRAPDDGSRHPRPGVPVHQHEGLTAAVVAQE